MLYINFTFIINHKNKKKHKNYPRINKRCKKEIEQVKIITAFFHCKTKKNTRAKDTQFTHEKAFKSVTFHAASSTSGSH